MKVNPDPPDATPDAVIVIFGAAVRPDGEPSQTLRLRVAAASRFAGQFAHPLFIPTGGKGRHGDPEAEVMARLLTTLGHKPASIRLEPTGTDTLSSVRAVRRLIPTNAPVYACSSRYHLPRCLLLLRMAGIRAKACPPPHAPTRWYWRLREAPALPYDAILMLGLRLTGRV